MNNAISYQLSHKKNAKPKGMTFFLKSCNFGSCIAIILPYPTE